MPAARAPYQGSSPCPRVGGRVRVVAEGVVGWGPTLGSPEILPGDRWGTHRNSFTELERPGVRV